MLMSIYSSGALHPFGERNTTIGQRGRVATPLFRHFV